MFQYAPNQELKWDIEADAKAKIKDQTFFTFSQKILLRICKKKDVLNNPFKYLCTVKSLLTPVYIIFIHSSIHLIEKHLQNFKSTTVNVCTIHVYH